MTAQHIIQAGTIAPSLAVSMEEIKDMACIQFCLGNHECGKDGALLQFVEPRFMYTLMKSRCTCVKHKVQDITAIFYIASIQEYQYLIFSFK